MDRINVIVAGGGAAGFFGAMACAEHCPGTSVSILEKSSELLAKVAISGGGRCNATHACFDPKELATRYPRGGQELIGPFHRWQPRDTIAWFAERGVELKTEPDGRMFPVTDKSSTIVRCLEQSARRLGITLRTRCGLAAARRVDGPGFEIEMTDGSRAACDVLLLATGGNRQSGGLEVAESLGHTIEPPVPSLFTFNIDDPRLHELSGISVPAARVEAVGMGLRQQGPVLVTHWGLSGPAILKLSAWGARSMADCGYVFEIEVNWLGETKRAAVLEQLAGVRAANPAKLVGTFSPVDIPVRLWRSLTRHAGISETARWAAVANRDLERLADALMASRFAVDGKSLFKDEFVTCGGVRLREVDFKSMESRICPGLYFAGEILDIDGVTGGFNFQAAWTTGWIAGRAMAERVAREAVS